MKKILITIVIILAAAGNISAKVYKVGDKEIIIPAPAGYSEVEPEHNITKYFEAMITPNSKRIASFIDDTIIESLLNDKSAGYKRYLQAFIVIDFKDKHFDDKLFNEFKAYTKGILSRKPVSKLEDVKTSEENFKKAVNASSKIAGVDYDLKPEEAAFLGIDDEGERNMSYSLLSKIKFTFEKPEESFEALFAASSGMVMVNGKLIHLMVLSEYVSEKDIGWTRDMLRTWTADIISANDPANKGKFLNVYHELGAIKIAGFILILLILFSVIYWRLKKAKSKSG